MVWLITTLNAKKNSRMLVVANDMPKPMIDC